MNHMGHRPVLIVCAASRLGVALAAAPAHASQDRRSNASTASSSAPAVVEVSSKVNYYGRTEASDIYGGLVVTDDTANKMTVYLTQLDPAVEAQFESVAGEAGDITFARTPATYDEQLSLHETVMKNWQLLADHGIHIIDFWPEERDGKEHLGVDLPINETQREFIAATIGDNYVVSNEQPVALTSDRSHDSSPWAGGDAIWASSHPDEGGCTLGVGVADGTDRSIMTAGHCFAVSHTIHNAYCTVAGSCTSQSGSNGTIGTVDDTALTDWGDDVELIGATGGDFWGGSNPGSPTLYSYDGYTESIDGWTVWNEGAYSGAVSSVVDSHNHCLIPAGQTLHFCHEVKATATGIANQGGDSGGPVLRNVNSTKYAVGTVSLGDGTATCVYHTYVSCYSILYFVDIQSELDDFGVSFAG